MSVFFSVLLAFIAIPVSLWLLGLFCCIASNILDGVQAANDKRLNEEARKIRERNKQ